MIENPHLLPKIRSLALRRAAIIMPCTLKIGTFIGIPCSGRDTNVMCHLKSFGSGVGTKVSDLNMACGCFSCHELLDYERNSRGRVIREQYPHAFWEQLFKAHCETVARWIALGLIPIGDDWEVV